MLNTLKELRTKTGETQAQIAKKLNISTMTYCGYEKGNREPNIDMLSKLANYFNVSIDYLVNGNLDATITKHEKEFIKKFRILNDDKKFKVLGYIDSLINN